MSKSEAPQWVLQFLERQRLDPHPCMYGHTACSDKANGPCLDEVLHQFPDLAEGA